jgi:hypothetical protein
MKAIRSMVSPFAAAPAFLGGDPRNPRPVNREYPRPGESAHSPAGRAEPGCPCPAPLAGKARCAHTLSLPRRLIARFSNGHQALVAHRWWFGASRITGTGVDARNRSARFPAPQRVSSLQGHGHPASPRLGCASGSEPFGVRAIRVPLPSGDPRDPRPVALRRSARSASRCSQEIRAIRVSLLSGDPRDPRLVALRRSARSASRCAHKIRNIRG